MTNSSHGEQSAQHILASETLSAGEQRQNPTIQISDARLHRLGSKEFRHVFLREMVTGWIAHQIRVLRKERHWTQWDLGNRCQKPQSTIGRVESPSYGRWNIGTLLDLAEAFDVALEVKFVDWPTAIRGYANLTPDAMRVPSWADEQFTTRRGGSSSTGTRTTFYSIDNPDRSSDFNTKKGTQSIRSLNSHIELLAS